MTHFAWPFPSTDRTAVLVAADYFTENGLYAFEAAARALVTLPPDTSAAYRSFAVGAYLDGFTWTSGRLATTYTVSYPDRWYFTRYRCGSGDFVLSRSWSRRWGRVCARVATVYKPGRRATRYLKWTTMPQAAPA